jgi:predicted permease
VVGLATIFFGLAPAVAATRITPAAALKANAGLAGGDTSATGGRSHLARWLVGGEMALALVLLIGTGLFLRTLVNLETLDPGFRKDHLLTLELSPVQEGKPTGKPSVLTTDLQRQLAALPGVLSVTWSSDLLLVGNLFTRDVRIDSRSDIGMINVALLNVGPHYFETMGIPVLAGRSIQHEDCQNNATVVWVNQTLAQRYYHNLSPLGDRIKSDRPREIVGVVGDTKYQMLRSEIEPTIYVPARSATVFTLRTATGPLSLASAVRETVKQVTPNLLVRNVKSQSERIAQQLFTERLLARLSAIFGLLALALAMVGIYGVLACSVARRTGEIAIRMSLGATPLHILRLVLAEGLLPAIVGSAVGLLASYGLTRLVAAFLFGVQPLDPLTYAAATLVLLGTAALACYIPARRAMRVDPMAALRYE